VTGYIISKKYDTDVTRVIIIAANRNRFAILYRQTVTDLFKETRKSICSIFQLA